MREIQIATSKIIHSDILLSSINSLSGFDGFSTQKDLIRIFAPDGDTSNDVKAQDIFTGHNALIVSTDLAQINTIAPGEEATITCSDATISGDANVDYIVWNVGIQEATGSQSVVAGTMTLTFSSGTVGIFLIEIRRQGATEYETGYITIEVVE